MKVKLFNNRNGAFSMKIKELFNSIKANPSLQKIKTEKISYIPFHTQLIELHFAEEVGRIACMTADDFSKIIMT